MAESGVMTHQRLGIEEVPELDHHEGGEEHGQLMPSDRDGYMHLYLYDMNGKLIRQVEKGNYDVTEICGLWCFMKAFQRIFILFGSQ